MLEQACEVGGRVGHYFVDARMRAVHVPPMRGLLRAHWYRQLQLFSPAPLDPPHRGGSFAVVRSPKENNKSGEQFGGKIRASELTVLKRGDPSKNAQGI